MANHVSIRGFVSSEFEMRNTTTGLVIGNFRIGSTERRQDPITKLWVDGRTNWYRINVFRSLAQNAVSSIHKGDRIMVMGKLNIKSFLRKDGTHGTSVEIDAESVGPDLQFGTALFRRMASAHPAGENGFSQESNVAAGTHLSVVGNDEDQTYDDADDDADGEADQLHGFAAVAAAIHAHAEDDQDDQDGEDDDTGPEDDSGLNDGERADHQTGEILKTAAPF